MKYDEIIARVAERTGLFEGEAAALTRATLATLAERIGGAEARDLATRLPGPLQDAHRRICGAQGIAGSAAAL